jgi:DNA-binding transcriptional MerR regulator
MMTGERYDIVLCRRDSERLTLDRLAAHTDMHPAMVERFVACGLITPVEWQGDVLLFEPSAVPRLRIIARLRDNLGINVAGIAVIMDLLDRLRDLQRANELLRSRL